jgi:hypothetical protein
MRTKEVAVILAQFERELSARADRLRETAEQLRRGEIHSAHAANRIAKIANEISKEKK